MGDFLPRTSRVAARQDRDSGTLPLPHLPQEVGPWPGVAESYFKAPEGREQGGNTTRDGLQRRASWLVDQGPPQPRVHQREHVRQANAGRFRRQPVLPFQFEQGVHIGRLPGSVHHELETAKTPR